MGTSNKNSMDARYLGYLLIVILLSMESTFAANIIVVVKERGSGVPIEGATVVINDGDAYDETGETGEIEFSNIDAPNKIKVLAAGFETLEKSVIESQKTITLYLEPFFVDGEGLNVSAERLVEKASKLTLTSVELIKAAGSGGDPLKAITSLPGIIATSEGSAEIYMRGSNGNENITWVNNTPVGYLYHFGGFQSTINPALIEDINVFLGGFPVQYGDALGGVVDAKLRAPKNDRIRYKLDVSTIVSSFLIEGPVGKPGGDSFFIAGRRSYLDLIFSPSAASNLFLDGGKKEEQDQILLVPRFYDFQALYRRQLNHGYVDGFVFLADDEMEMELRSVAKIDPQIAGQVREKKSYQSFGFTWQQRWNRPWDSLVTLAFIREKDLLRMGRDEFGEAFVERSKSDTIYLQPELRWQIRENSLLSFGLSSGYSRIPVEVYGPRGCTEEDVDCDITTLKKFRLNKTLKGAEISPYIKYRQKWTDRLTTQIGLRHTNIELTGGFHTHKLSPRATLEYQLTPNTLLTTTWGKYIQMPTGEEVIKPFGNPALLVREAEHRILGVEHQFNPLYSVKAEVYHKPMKNLVIPIDENDPPNNYANRGTGEAYGFDLFIKRAASQGKIGWVSFSWARSRRTNEVTNVSRDFSGDQPLTFVAVWGQPFGGSWKRWDWSIKAEARSGKPYTAVKSRFRDDENNRWIAEYGKQNAERMPVYYRFDLRIGREVLFNQSKLKFYIDVQNLTFAKNIVDFDYGNEYEKIDKPTKITGTSFFPFFGVEMEF